MLRPDLFGALATHAGDSLYELCYLADFGNAARALRGHDHDIHRWWAVWIDAGRSDEYYLDLGAEAFRARIAEAGIPGERVHFELFDAGHGGIDYRYPLSPGWLAEKVAR